MFEFKLWYCRQSTVNKLASVLRIFLRIVNAYSWRNTQIVCLSNMLIKQSSSTVYNVPECQWSTIEKRAVWCLESFFRWGQGSGRREGGVQGALFLANENRLDWLWERAWFQLYWRQAYCVNAIPPTTTTLSSVYSLWHVFSSITFCCALFLSFLFFKHFFPDPFFAGELNRRRASRRSSPVIALTVLRRLFSMSGTKVCFNTQSRSQGAFPSV